jgi:hypothetical protein
MKKCFIAGYLLTLVSCTYQKTSLAPPTANIIISTPFTNQHFVKGDTIRISGIVTHSIPLDAVAVHMTDLANDNEFFHNHFLVDNKLQYDFNATYVVPDNTKTSFKIQVEAQDTDFTESSKEMIITIN